MTMENIDDVSCNTQFHLYQAYASTKFKQLVCDHT